MDIYEEELLLLLDGHECAHFAVSIRGGLWTLQNVGKVADATRGRYKTTEAKNFLNKYRMQLSKDFPHSELGSELAGFMAKLWCF